MALLSRGEERKILVTRAMYALDDKTTGKT